MKCTLCCFLLALGSSSVQGAVDCSAHTGTAKAIAEGHDMTGKVVVLTGSDTGVGYETALALAGQNATITIANHNAAKGQAAVANITRITGNTKVEALQLDLASFDSTRKVAATLLGKHKVIDVLVNDAGVGTPWKVTDDGFEYVLQVNYLSHFLLEQLLLPALRASSGGKLIHVSSGASYSPCQAPGSPSKLPSDCTDLDEVAEIIKTNTTISTYGLSKFLMVYNARELSVREAARGSKVRGYAIRPGLVDTPLVERTMSKQEQKTLCSIPNCAAGWRNLRCDDPCPMSPSAGAVSPTYVAVTDLPAEQDGDFYWQCKVASPPTWKNAEANQAKLYDMSLQWTSTGTDSMMSVV